MTQVIEQTIRPMRGRKLPGFVLCASLILVTLGLTQPALTVSAFWIYDTQISILQGIQSFFDQGQVALGFLVLAVSVVFPVLKILISLAALLVAQPGKVGTERLLTGLIWLGKWSMTDVFVFALMVLVLNGKIIASADIHQGVALFAAGVLLSALGTSMVRRRLKPLL
ncbi:MAG: paraquat-inducible protein A [Parvibaculaceae bacterium]|nr:paraquat-inducible protein A [Parvibaculaceae bacterium]